MLTTLASHNALLFSNKTTLLDVIICSFISNLPSTSFPCCKVLRLRSLCCKPFDALVTLLFKKNWTINRLAARLVSHGNNLMSWSCYQGGNNRNLKTWINLINHVYKIDFFLLISINNACVLHVKTLISFKSISVAYIAHSLTNIIMSYMNYFGVAYVQQSTGFNILLQRFILWTILHKRH